MPTRVETLDNGLKVILRPIPDTKALSKWVVYRIGSRNEVPGMTGSTHWVEHMLFKGGGKLGKGDIDKMISRLGGKMNAFTDTDYTMYFETIPAGAMDTALMIESERMRNAAFDPKEVEAERTVVISEREGAENQPDFAVEEELWGLAFHVHPYHWTAIGYKQDLATLDRDPLYRHYLRFYAPNNASLVLVGGFDPAVAMQHIREAFGPLKPETPPQQCRAWARYEQDGDAFRGIVLSAGEGLGSWEFDEGLLAKVEKVRAEQVRAVARAYLVDAHRTVVRFHAQEVPA